MAKLDKAAVKAIRRKSQSDPGFASGRLVNTVFGGKRGPRTNVTRGGGKSG